MIIVPNKDTDLQSSLEEVRVLTTLMNENKNKIKELQERRLSAIIYLRESGVTYSEIAKYMGTTYQSIYKVLKDSNVQPKKKARKKTSTKEK
jgi:DNA invertase Pin-like site-specific DNA recombinase